MTICNNCLSKSIEVLSAQETVKYKGKEIPFLIEYSLCSDCAHEFVSSEQVSNNDTRLRDYKKSIDGLLTSEEIRQARRQLKLTQEQASLVFGGGKNAFSKYERDEVSQSKAMDKLIRTCLHHPGAFKDLLQDAGISERT
ncbi:hypothetical protein MNBD_GAMMA01-1969 [hydrothermal vent metagenome]|uniref:HTH cro/C1-type domain-containing protein n=1 Tax=hydrothermal vent metagenome TaxID=652676 RepID=A0A3B0VJS2_9ZZZZ